MTKAHGAWIGNIITGVMLLLIVRLSPYSSENGPQATRHALRQCPHPSRQKCSPRLTQFGQIGRRMIPVSDPDWNLIPEILYWDHAWTHSWPVHNLDVMLIQQSCHVGHVAGHCLAQTQSSLRRPLSPKVTFDPSESGCSDACSSSRPRWPGCSSRHDGLHPRP